MPTRCHFVDMELADQQHGHLGHNIDRCTRLGKLLEDGLHNNLHLGGMDCWHRHCNTRCHELVCTILGNRTNHARLIIVSVSSMLLLGRVLLVLIVVSLVVFVLIVRIRWLWLMAVAIIIVALWLARHDCAYYYYCKTVKDISVDSAFGRCKRSDSRVSTAAN